MWFKVPQGRGWHGPIGSEIGLFVIGLFGIGLFGVGVFGIGIFGVGLFGISLFGIGFFRIGLSVVLFYLIAVVFLIAGCRDSKRINSAESARVTRFTHLRCFNSSCRCGGRRGGRRGEPLLMSGYLFCHSDYF